MADTGIVSGAGSRGEVSVVIVSSLIQIPELIEITMHIQQNNFGLGGKWGRRRGKRGGQKKQELSRKADDNGVVTGKEHYQPQEQDPAKMNKQSNDAASSMDGESVNEGMNTPETGSTISDHSPNPSGQDILLLDSPSAPAGAFSRCVYTPCHHWRRYKLLLWSHCRHICNVSSLLSIVSKSLLVTCIQHEVGLVLKGKSRSRLYCGSAHQDGED